ncbi:MAG: hypothetical protein A4E23_00337 [Methanomethylovorans sp. PtaU1.Bin073]|nr:MAG: hypothetical protein A4E23_00337 [Methanomethylovorans sp. PtaU1.Bin073]
MSTCFESVINCILQSIEIFLLSCFTGWKFHFVIDMRIRYRHENACFLYAINFEDHVDICRVCTSPSSNFREFISSVLHEFDSFSVPFIIDKSLQLFNTYLMQVLIYLYLMLAFHHNARHLGTIPYGTVTDRHLLSVGKLYLGQIIIIPVCFHIFPPNLQNSHHHARKCFCLAFKYNSSLLLRELLGHQANVHEMLFYMCVQIKRFSSLICLKDL